MSRPFFSFRMPVPLNTLRPLTTSRYSGLVGPGYFVAATLVLFPVMDLVANAWPLDPGRVNWRYGAYMLLSGFVLTMLLGMAVAVFIGRAAGHRRTVRTLAALGALTGAVLLAAAIAFALDALQLRAGVAAEARTQFGIGAVKAIAKNTTAAVGFLWIAWAGWRGSGKAQKRRARSADPLMK